MTSSGNHTGDMVIIAMVVAVSHPIALDFHGTRKYGKQIPKTKLQRRSMQ